MYNDQFRGGANLTRWDGVMKLTKMGITVKGTIISLVILAAVMVAFAAIYMTFGTGKANYDKVITSVIDSIKNVDGIVTFKVPDVRGDKQLEIDINGTVKAADGSVSSLNLTDELLSSVEFENPFSRKKTYALDISNIDYSSLIMEIGFLGGKVAQCDFLAL